MMTLASGTGYTVGPRSSASGTIDDNDTASLTIGEQLDHRGRPQHLDGRCDSHDVGSLGDSCDGCGYLRLGSGTGAATAGTDYQSNPETLMIAAGQMMVMISIVVTVT